ncbi:hypothetical protein SELMODRAFT_431928 [Selaginella moellendorffii]|uniref:Calcineurin-like phosphoesterase domain-containing protein n=1 Tax=Selaginella moellendorffii TaxID=88036 RepID=D8TEE8_SELML|nr:hypothetical protein SELMODRAFT_431928 [Selaginella moellendorffii]
MRARRTTGCYAKSRQIYGLLQENGAVYMVLRAWCPVFDKYAWMKSDLESVDRFSTPWIVFTGHRPMYSTQLWGIILKLYQVDLAVWGHVHSYERTCAVFQGRCLQHLIKDLAGVDFFDTTIYSAPVHVVVGMAEFSLDDFPRNFMELDLKVGIWICKSDN